MKIARLFGGFAALCALAGAGVVAAGIPARSFDIQTSPTVVKRPAADITDTYFFPSPTNASNVVAVMDVYPGIAAGQGVNTFFDQSVVYTMRFDNAYGQRAAGAKPLENEVVQFSFGAPGNGTQQVFVYGPAAPSETGASTTLVDGGNYTATGFVNRPFQATASFFGTSTFSVFAGARRDPSFFNNAQFSQIFPDRNMGSTAQSCLPSGTNTCPRGFTNSGQTSNSNVLAIAIEIPKSQLVSVNNGIVAYWATTSTQSGQ